MSDFLLVLGRHDGAGLGKINRDPMAPYIHFRLIHLFGAVCVPSGSPVHSVDRSVSLLC